jgi:hypothetical protein
MMKLIGVAPPSALQDIKRELLLFDQLAITHDEKDWEFRSKDPSLAADLDWLEQKGLVFKSYQAGNIELGFEMVEQKKGRGILLRPTQVPKRDRKGEILEPLGLRLASKLRNRRVRDLTLIFEDFLCRLESEHLRSSEDTEAVSIRPPFPEVSETFGIKTEKGHVARIVIKEIPEPSEATSLERILEFRQDPETKRKMLSLRRWIHNTATKQLPQNEVAEELEWLIAEYQQHMRLHDMKYNRGALEIVVKTIGELAEDLAKFRFGKMSTLPFSLSHRRIDLLEAELKAPGREIAYVVHARTQFRR